MGLWASDGCLASRCGIGYCALLVKCWLLVNGTVDHGGVGGFEVGRVLAGHNAEWVPFIAGRRVVGGVGTCNVLAALGGNLEKNSVDKEGSSSAQGIVYFSTWSRSTPE